MSANLNIKEFENFDHADAVMYLAKLSNDDFESQLELVATAQGTKVSYLRSNVSSYKRQMAKKRAIETAQHEKVDSVSDIVFLGGTNGTGGTVNNDAACSGSTMENAGGTGGTEDYNLNNVPDWVSDCFQESIDSNHSYDDLDIPNGNIDPDWVVELRAHVARFNRNHASVIIGGRHKVMRTVAGSVNSHGRETYEFIGRKELQLVHDHTKIKVGEKTVRGDIVDILNNHLMAWANHKNCRSYVGGVIFRPNKEAPAGYFNTWRGFTVKPKQGNCDLIKSHIEDVVCDGDSNLIEYFYNWVAYTLQNPDKPAGAALVCRGEQGSGKGTIGNFLSGIWGNHSLYISNPAHLVGNFNAHLADVCFLFADEAFFSGDKKHEGVLKSVITEPSLTVERKGIDVVQQPNYLKVFMATNSEFAVPASRDVRRYCIFDVSPKRIGDKVYFDRLHKECGSKVAQSAFLFEMLNRDISKFHTGMIPESIGLMEQRYHSLNAFGKWIVDCLRRGTFDGDTGKGSFPYKELSSALYDSFLRWCDVMKIDQYGRLSQTEWGRKMREVFPIKDRDSTGRAMYVTGHLNEAIAAYEKLEKIRI